MKYTPETEETQTVNYRDTKLQMQKKNKIIIGL
jgi:hypothetical protein